MMRNKHAGGVLTTRYFESDENFNTLFPERIQEVAARHWTPIEVAKKASDFLSTGKGVRVLDIGSGAGKFCLAAAHFHPEAHFTGIEQRENLVDLCNGLKKKLNLTNADFICGNMKELEFAPFDNFYFYNSFYENIPGTQKIDYQVIYSEKTYDYYNSVLYRKLDSTPVGTRLVTYHSLCREVPPGFEILHTDYAEFLKFWQKV